MRSSLIATLLFVAPALCLPGISRAQESPDDALPYLLAGPVIVQPSLALKVTYRDNVLYSESDPTGDFVTAIVPDLRLRLPFRTHEVSLGAGAAIERYAELTSEDSSSYRVDGEGNFTIGDRVALKAGGAHRRDVETPLESPNGTTDEYTTTAAELSLNYAFVDVSQARLDYRKKILDYPESSYRSRDEDTVGIRLSYRFLPATSAFLEVDVTAVAYENAADLDNDVQRGSLGATWEITEHSQGTARAGYLAKSFTDASLKNYTTWTASVDLSHTLTPAAAVRLLGSRDVHEGKQAGTRYYTTTGVFVDVTYQFLDRLAGVLDVSYFRDEFSEPLTGASAAREDTTARAGVGANYSFNSWLDFSLGYSYLNRDSNVAGLSATVNAVTFTVTARR